MADIPLAFKASYRQWNGYLATMNKGQRSRYISEAVRAYIAEHPVMNALPLDEPKDEEIRHISLRFHLSPEEAVWWDQIPSQMRSYTVRHMLNWYRRRVEAVQDPQQRFDLSASSP